MNCAIYGVHDSVDAVCANAYDILNGIVHRKMSLKTRWAPGVGDAIFAELIVLYFLSLARSSLGTKKRGRDSSTAPQDTLVRKRTRLSSASVSESLNDSANVAVDVDNEARGEGEGEGEGEVPEGLSSTAVELDSPEASDGRLISSKNDFAMSQRRQNAIDLAILSPPWGGPGYEKGYFDLQSMISCGDGMELAKLAIKACENIVYLVPKNTDKDQLVDLARSLSVPWFVEDIHLNGKLKMTVAYYGKLFLHM